MIVYRSRLFIRTLGWATGAIMVIALWTVFIYAPADRTIGDVQRIFYFHLPVALVAFAAFSIVFLGGVLYLATRKVKWDLLAGCAAEIGTVFCTLVLVTGIIWGKASWGTWWTWDPRLTTTLVLWLIYVAYLVTRAAVDESSRASFSAVYGIIGFIDVPIVFMSIRWWRSIHPQIISSQGIGLGGAMLVTLLVNIVAFILLFAYLLVQRYGVASLEARFSELRQRSQLL
jgi:heme exporter protein C